MSIIDRLRDPYRDECLHNDDRVAMLEAADELERLYAAMADGPVAWMYEHEEFGVEIHTHRYGSDTGGNSDHYVGWNENPLYFIPAPEPKP